MSKVGEKVAYLKGLAEGLGVNDETEQGKLMLAMIDTLEALAKNSEETDERVERALRVCRRNRQRRQRSRGGAVLRRGR